MPEARIRVAALHLARARTLPLLCLGIGGGLQSRLVHHARSALKQQKSSSATRRRTGGRLLMSALAAATHFASGRLKKSARPIAAAEKTRRTNPCKYCICYRARQKISVYG